MPPVCFKILNYFILLKPLENFQSSLQLFEILKVQAKFALSNSITATGLMKMYVSLHLWVSPLCSWIFHYRNLEMYCRFVRINTESILSLYSYISSGAISIMNCYNFSNCGADRLAMRGMRVRGESMRKSAWRCWHTHLKDTMSASSLTGRRAYAHLRTLILRTFILLLGITGYTTSIGYIRVRAAVFANNK